jgi:ADP-heptose:LPS heptosyltransferase
VSGTRPLAVVLRALGLGDFLTAVPALRGLARAAPGHETVLLCPGELAPLVMISRTVDTVAHCDFRTRAPRAEDLPALPARPDVCVNLHGRGPQSHAALRSLRPRRLIAHAEPRSCSAGPPWLPERHEVDRWCDLLRWHGVEADPTDLRLDVEPLRPPLAGTGACVVLHPGASSPARRWPVPRWVAVARALRVVGHPVVVTGGSAEHAVAAEIAGRAGLPGDHVLAGRTSLPELAGIIAGARALVSGDSGPAHLATAVGTRSVVLFGPTAPSLWGPRIDRHRHAAIWRGRRGDPHASRLDAGLLGISPADVLAALRDVSA